MAESFHNKFQQTIAVITFCFIAIRLYIRCWVRWRFPTLSDYFVLAAWGMYCTAIIVDEVIVPKMDFENSQADVLWWNKWVYYWQIQYFTIYYCIKASLLLFYNEWIPRSLNKLWIANRILMVICAICYLYTALANALRCQPVRLQWEGGCPPAKGHWLTISTSVLHLFTDLLIYILPVFVLWYMSAVPTRKKMGAAFMFLLGIVSIVFSALRFGLTVYYWGHPNGKVTLSVIYVSQNLDESAGIFVVCCPQIKLFVGRVVRFWRRKYYVWTGKPLPTEFEMSSMKNSGRTPKLAGKGSLGSLYSTAGMVTNISSPGMDNGAYLTLKSPVQEEIGQTVFPYEDGTMTQEDVERLQVEQARTRPSQEHHSDDRISRGHMRI